MTPPFWLSQNQFSISSHFPFLLEEMKSQMFDVSEAWLLWIHSMINEENDSLLRKLQEKICFLARRQMVWLTYGLSCPVLFMLSLLPAWNVDMVRGQYVVKSVTMRQQGRKWKSRRERACVLCDIIEPLSQPACLDTLDTNLTNEPL